MQYPYHLWQYISVNSNSWPLVCESNVDTQPLPQTNTDKIWIMSSFPLIYLKKMIWNTFKALVIQKQYNSFLSVCQTTSQGTMEGCTVGNIFILCGNCFTCGWIFAVYRLYWREGRYTVNTTGRSRGSGSHKYTLQTEMFIEFKWLYLNRRVACILGRKWLVIGCKKVRRVRTCLDPSNYKKFLDLLL